MRTLPRFAVAISLAVALAGCATRPVEPVGVTFVLVRHAEKASDDPLDPGLTEAGRARAARLMRSLHDAPVRAVYATRFRRTQQTAAPTAGGHGLPVTSYDASRPAPEMAAYLRSSHTAGTVLVVGHSNTIPALAGALCDCAIAPIGDAAFDRRITITTTAEGRAAVDDRREP